MYAPTTYTILETYHYIILKRPVLRVTDLLVQPLHMVQLTGSVECQGLMSKGPDYKGSTLFPLLRCAEPTNYSERKLQINE